MEQEPAERLLEKMRRFIAEDLDEAEQAMLAMLLAPGISLIYEETETAGFSMVSVASGEFAELLGRALRKAGVKVAGIGL